MDNRKLVIVPENKDKIRKIKERYHNLQMSDDVAQRISQLEVANNILKTSSNVAAIAAAIDWIIPDPVPGLDEAALTALGPLMKMGSVMVEKQIDELAKNGNMNLDSNDIRNFTAQLATVMTTIKNGKNQELEQSTRAM